MFGTMRSAPSPSRTGRPSVSTTGPQVMPSRSVKCAFATSTSGTTMPTWYSCPWIAMRGSLRSLVPRRVGPVAGVAERALPEREHLGRPHREHVHRCGVGVGSALLVGEAAVAHAEGPAAVPLVGPCARESPQRGVVGHAHGLALDDDVRPLVPAVATGRQHDVRVD